jgi:AraC-like DNA-binding protein
VIPKNDKPLQLQLVPGGVQTSICLKQHPGAHDSFFWHYHPEIELMLVRQDQGLHFVRESIRQFGDGDLCLLGGNLPHCWYSKPSPRRRQHSMYVHFLPHFAGQDFFKPPEMRPIEKLLKRASRGLCFHGRTRQLVSKRLLSLFKSEPGSWRQIHELVWILGTLAESTEYEFLSAGDEDQLLSKRANRRLEQIVNFMGADASAVPSREMASRHVRLTPQSFSRFFKQQTGKTYANYRNELRVQTACRLLLDTDHSITEIALRSGFNNLSNFNKQFLRSLKVTPHVYRTMAPARKTMK